METFLAEKVVSAEMTKGAQKSKTVSATHSETLFIQTLFAVLVENRFY